MKIQIHYLLDSRFGTSVKKFYDDVEAFILHFRINSIYVF